jgi:hypothetical protein
LVGGQLVILLAGEGVAVDWKERVEAPGFLVDAECIARGRERNSSRGFIAGSPAYGGVDTAGAAYSTGDAASC